MPLLIDTFNVLHTVGVLPPDLAGVDVQGLIGLVELSRYRAEKATLVCDGTPQATGLPPIAGADGQISIRHSGAGKPADDLIAQMIRASSAPRRLIVVSSDHAVLNAARKRRCRTLTSAEFLQQLVDDARLDRGAPEPSKPHAASMSQEQIDRWVKIFAVDPELIEASLAQHHPALEEDLDRAARSAEEQDDASAAPPAAHPLEPDPALLRDLAALNDAIREAEQLWRAQNPSPTSGQPIGAKQTEVPNPDSIRDDQRATGESENAGPLASAAPAKDDQAVEVNQAADELNLDELDMSKWLPADGKTRRLERHD